MSFLTFQISTCLSPWSTSGMLLWDMAVSVGLFCLTALADEFLKKKKLELHVQVQRQVQRQVQLQVQQPAVAVVPRTGYWRSSLSFHATSPPLPPPPPPPPSPARTDLTVPRPCCSSRGNPGLVFSWGTKTCCFFRFLFLFLYLELKSIVLDLLI